MDISFADISRMTLFRGFDEGFVKLLDVFFVAREYEEGTILIEQGKMQSTFYLIIAGEVGVFSVTPDGRETPIGHVVAGQFVGEMNLFDPATATARVGCLTPVVTLEISNEKFRQFMEAKPAAAADFMFQLAQVIVRRYRSSMDTLIDEAARPENIEKAEQIDRINGMA
jgi:CRP-like cAMP-binding protein